MSSRPGQCLLLTAGATVRGGAGPEQGREQPGTNLSKISRSAHWGQEEKESPLLKSPQINPPHRQGHGKRRPREHHSPSDPARLLLTPALALGGAAPIPGLRLQHLPLPASGNEGEWLRVTHLRHLARGNVCCPSRARRQRAQEGHRSCHRSAPTRVPPPHPPVKTRCQNTLRWQQTTPQALGQG